MSDTANLLIELGTEELPPKALDELSAAFCAGIVTGLKQRGIALDETSARALQSPRRLAVRIDALALVQPEQKLERRGPALAAALDAAGQPTKALLGFAASNGVGVTDLHRLETDKGSWFVFRSVTPGQRTATLLPAIINEALQALPIPRPMRWSDLDYLFVRPAHWLIILLGDQVVPGSVLGLQSDRISRGHRFHHPEPVWIANPESYIDALRAAQVLVDPAERLARIRAEVARVTLDIGGSARLDAALLAEVNNLVEWPIAIACTFEREFLEVPQEALITTMESNQKFFPVFDSAGRLTEHFVGIANIASRDPAQIRQGYERVIRPRFADAKFFYDADLKTPLAAHQAALEQVTYQAKLGSVWDKVGRVSLLAQVVARRMQDGGCAIEIPLVERAVKLSKCDLLTRMVGEFPELQGIMGRTYASAQGEPAAVANALDEFYRPRFAGDAIAIGTVAQALAIAEKLDTLAGLFAIGQKPSGSKDPFSLRRTALGLARTLIEAGLDLDLVALIEEAIDHAKRAAMAMQKGNGKAIETVQQLCPPWDRSLDRDAIELYDFILERLRGYYLEQGIASELFEAVAVLKPNSLLDFDRRLRAVLAFSAMPEAASLAAANKRIGNILRQATEQQIALGREITESALEAGAETEFRQALAAAYADFLPLSERCEYVALLSRLALLRAPVDAFFDGVMVMSEHPVQRQNRLNLLNVLHAMFLRVADIGLLPGR